MKFSVWAFFSLAFSTSSRMRLTVEAPKSLVVRTRKTPVMLMQPEITSPPSSTWRGHGLAGEGRGVELRGAVDDDAVDGHAFARLDYDDVADGHLVGSTCTSAPSRSMLA